MKKILSATLALAMTLSLLPAAFAAGGTAYASTQAVEVDGKKVEFQMYALKDDAGNPTNYVKLRDVAHVLNGTKAQFSVGYDGSISVTTGQPYADAGGEMTTPYSGDRAYRDGSGAVKVNGQSASLESIILTDDAGGDYTYFKLRDLGSALGFKVDWTADRGVFIETGGASQPTAPASDGKLTLDQLQGIWHAEGDDIVIDLIISGNQITECRHVIGSDYVNYILNTGTITDFQSDYTLKDSVDETKTYPYAIFWSGTHERWGKGDLEPKKYSVTVTPDNPVSAGGYGYLGAYYIDEVDLENNRIGFKYMVDLLKKVEYRSHYEYTKASSSPVYDMYVADLKEAREAKEERGSVYEFLANYVTTNGKKKTYGDFKGQYYCYLDILGSLGTNKDWTYLIYADPDTGRVTLEASWASYSSGRYSISGSTFYTLELSPDGGPYRGSYRNSTSTDSILGSFGDTGTFRINPASFTSQTAALSFDSFSGSSSSQSFNEKNGAETVKIWLMALRKEILKPNGFTLSDLGFTSFN